MVGSTGDSDDLVTNSPISSTFPEPGSDYDAWAAEKRKSNARERTRRCRARKVELQSIAESQAVRSTNVDPKFIINGQKQAHRTSATLAREISLFAAKKMKNHDREVQHLTVMKLLGQPILKDMVPPFLKDPTAVKLRDEVLGSLKIGMQTHLVGLRKGKTLFAKNIVTTFAVGPGIGSGRGVAGLLGVDRRNIKKALARRALLDTEQDAFWLQGERRIRGDAIPDAVKKSITR